MNIPKFSKLYRVNSNYEIEEFTYLYGSDKEGHFLEDRSGVTVKLSESTISQYSLSKRVTLAELEEVLRSKINHVHDQMREMNMKFLKVSEVDVIYTRVIKASREIHQYDKRGMYIESFSNAKQASLKFGGLSPNNIREAANKDRKTAYGYLWSWQKVKRLV